AFYYSKPFKIYGTDQHWSFVVNAPKDEYLSNAIFIRNFSIIAVFVGLIIIAGIIFLSVRKLNVNLESISSGLENFFQYLNKKVQTTEPIMINSNDEFGLMAKNINENIENIKNSLHQDNQLIENVKEIANNLSEGYINKKIEKSTSTQSLNELKEILNGMIVNLELQVGQDINKTIEVLESYSNRDFTVSLNDTTSGKIGREINKMNEMINHMLQNSQADGLNLKNNSADLTQNIRIISSNATSQAASLEETAASIDEITSNISQTNTKAQQMLTISNETKHSAEEGKDLANKTVQSMEEINVEVTSINEAITVIDQIAFQTNILSLNAAVEAATAGEAGKGFAVVAQEVRNLASRSAEAAKGIKNLVESATAKANAGKKISNDMIQGFTTLEEKIENTSVLINDVTHAASEQSIGMAQISDAVNQLDRFTQQNAAIADETNSIASKTDSIANELVLEVEKNNFKGKNN
ncbi:MAG: methyl-accepting chemotaxis protein, partial [Arcobacteraceae bacterium]